MVARKDGCIDRSVIPCYLATPYHINHLIYASALFFFVSIGVLRIPFYVNGVNYFATIILLMINLSFFLFFFLRWMCKTAYLFLLGNGPEDSNSHECSASKTPLVRKSQEAKDGTLADLRKADGLDPISAAYLAWWRHEEACWGMCNVDGEGVAIQRPDTEQCKTHLKNVKQLMVRCNKRRFSQLAP